MYAFKFMFELTVSFTPSRNHYDSVKLTQISNIHNETRYTLFKTNSVSITDGIIYCSFELLFNSYLNICLRYDLTETCSSINICEQIT